MKILAINGSHRGRLGCTQLLLDKMGEGAQSAGGEFETEVLAERKINSCLACGFCGKPENLGHCVYETEDDVKDIMDKMRAADIVVYGSPVYVFGLTGRMKTFLDRLNSTGTGEGLCLTQSGLIFHPADRRVIGKPLVILTLCANLEQETVKNTLSYFSTFAQYVDAPIVGTLVRKMSMMLEEKDSPHVQEVLAAYVQAGAELVSQGRIGSGTERRANQHLLKIPFLDFLLHFRAFKRRAVEQANQDRIRQRKAAGLV
jgi:multimeric flavodoxin WrbA